MRFVRVVTGVVAVRAVAVGFEDLLHQWHAANDLR
jgi:hypothetical protein